jgi:hypothetical protein
MWLKLNDAPTRVASQQPGRGQHQERLSFSNRAYQSSFAATKDENYWTSLPLYATKSFMDRPGDIQHRTKLLALAVTQCLIVLPAVFALGVSAMRLVQPPQHEPAHTSWLILDWMSRHLDSRAAATIFLVFPGIALATGSTVLLRSWQRDDLLRWDTLALLAVFRRNLHMLLMIAGMLAGGTILMAAVVHMITD